MNQIKNMSIPYKKSFFYVECPFKFELPVLPTHHNESKIILKEKKNGQKLKSCGQTPSQVLTACVYIYIEGGILCTICWEITEDIFEPQINVCFPKKTFICTKNWTRNTHFSLIMHLIINQKKNEQNFYFTSKSNK